MDEKLVEVVARAIHETEEKWTPEQTSEDIALAALAAINASGTHWVAPWNATEGDAETSWIWDEMRDAYLAEQEKR